MAEQWLTRVDGFVPALAALSVLPQQLVRAGGVRQMAAPTERSCLSYQLGLTQFDVLARPTSSCAQDQFARGNNFALV